MAGQRSSTTCRLAILFALIGLSAARPVDRVRCGSSTGDVVIDVHHDWAPYGAKRFMELVHFGAYDNSPLFRVVPDFIVQWGIPANPEVTAHWKKYPIQDDVNIGIPTKRGTIGFTGGPKDSRVSELWISFQDSDHIGKTDQESPFAQIVEGMENVDNWYSGYGDMVAFGGHAPDQGRLYAEGVEYTRSEYPELSFITTCRKEEVQEEQQQPAEVQEPEVVAEEILNTANEIQNQQQEEAPASEPYHDEAEQAQAHEAAPEENQAVEAAEAHEVAADENQQPPATEAKAEPLSEPAQQEEELTFDTVTDLKTMMAWMKAEMEKAMQVKIPKLVHSPRDGEDSHEDEITAIIATVTLVVVIVAVSTSSGKKLKRL